MTNQENLLAQVSANHLWETNQAIAQWVRHSGTEEEREAFAYVQQTLQDYGLATTLLEHPALVSYPLDSSLEIVDGNGHAMVAYPTLGTAYSATVDALEAEVVDLQYGTEDDYAHSDVQGKFVLLNGLATPTAVFAAEAAGAIGQIFIIILPWDYIPNLIKRHKKPGHMRTRYDLLIWDYIPISSTIL